MHIEMHFNVARTCVQLDDMDNRANVLREVLVISDGMDISLHEFSSDLCENSKFDDFVKSLHGKFL